MGEPVSLGRGVQKEFPNHDNIAVKALVSLIFVYFRLVLECIRSLFLSCTAVSRILRCITFLGLTILGRYTEVKNSNRHEKYTQYTNERTFMKSREYFWNCSCHAHSLLIILQTFYIFTTFSVNHVITYMLPCTFLWLKALYISLTQLHIRITRPMTTRS